jgi:phosphoenolpyruvate carboxykinase (ATP)
LGDDEHGWSDQGVFNFEGGCYAKTYNLTITDEPQIFIASHRFGSIFENVALNDQGFVDFRDDTLTRNGRVSYPIDSVGRAMSVPFVESQPKTVIMLTCDAYGVLPAVCKLSKSAAREQFLLGYTSKVAGTESGIDDPIATFSPCFGLPFMPRAPEEYADLLVGLLEETGASCWLINTGWSGGPPGEGERIPLALTRAIVGMIVGGDMGGIPTFFHDYTGMIVPAVGGVPLEFLHPELAWSNPIMYSAQANKLMSLFKEAL